MVFCKYVLVERGEVSERPKEKMRIKVSWNRQPFSLSRQRRVSVNFEDETPGQTLGGHAIGAVGAVRHSWGLSIGWMTDGLCEGLVGSTTPFH